MLDDAAVVPRISVVMATLNRPELLDRCLSSSSMTGRMRRRKPSYKGGRTAVHRSLCGI
jgi:hypothetical protein